MRRLLAGLLLTLLPSLALGQAATIANGACRLDGVDCGVTASGVATAGTIAVWGSGPALGSFDWLTATDATKTVALPKGTLEASLVKATALSTPGSITVTPVLSKVASITTVAGAALVDGDYLTVEYDTGLTVPIEFDLSPGDGTSGGRVPLLFTAGDSADLIRDNLILLLNAAVPASLTASSGGAATVSIVLDTPGAAGGTLSENVAAGGFAVTGFANPPAATTVTYKLVAKLADGTATDAGSASSTAASTATLSAANFLRLTWSAVTGAASYDVYRTVAPTTPATTGKIIASTTALTLDDTGLAGGGETAPTTGATGRLVSTALTSGRIALVGTGGQIQDDSGLTYSGTGATFSLVVPSVLSQENSIPTTWVNWGTTSNGLAQVKRWGGFDYGFVGNYDAGLYLGANGTVRWTATSFGDGTPDTSLSRISAGVLGVGNGTAGDVSGTVVAAKHAIWSATDTYLGYSGGQNAGSVILAESATPVFAAGSNAGANIQGLMLARDYRLSWGVIGGLPDAFVTRRAAATLQLGAADSATPVAQTLAFQGSRGGTDTNTAGADATIQGSLGTGTAASGKILFKVGTPAASGSTQHTANTVLTLQDTGTGGTAAPQVLFPLGSATKPGLSFVGYETAGITNAGGEMVIISPKLEIRGTGASPLLTITEGGTARWVFNKTTTAEASLIPNDDVARDIGDASHRLRSMYVGVGIKGGKSKTLTDASPTDFATIPLADGAATGGKLIYRVVATNGGTSRQVVSGSINYAAVRDGATYAVDYDEVQQSTAVTTGTLTGSVTCAGASDLLTFSANFDTDLGTPVLTIYYRFDSTDTLAVTGL